MAEKLIIAVSCIILLYIICSTLISEKKKDNKINDNIKKH